MKWFFWFFVLVNLAIFLWPYGDSGTDASLQPRAPVNPDSMRLLDAKRPRAFTAAGIQAGVAGGSAAAGQRACYAVGPFATRDAATKAAVALKDLRLVHGFRAEKEKVVEGYRVLVAGLESAAAAEILQTHLNERGFDGHYVIRFRQGSAVALGFFAELANAEKLLQRLTAIGVQGELIVREREGDLVHWIDFQDPATGRPVIAVLQQMEWGIPDVSVWERPCL